MERRIPINDAQTLIVWDASMQAIEHRFKEPSQFKGKYAPPRLLDLSIYTVPTLGLEGRRPRPPLIEPDCIKLKDWQYYDHADVTDILTLTPYGPKNLWRRHRIHGDQYYVNNLNYPSRSKETQDFLDDVVGRILDAEIQGQPLF